MKDFLSYKLLEVNEYSFTVQNIVNVILIILSTKLLLFIFKKFLLKVYKNNNERQNDLYTVIKIVSYFFWFVAIISILNSLGIKVTALLTGSAALLVGIGLGLQQTFNDFISGIILLFEGKTKVGDILEVEGKLMRLENIGLRTTEGTDRDGVSIIIPNSKIVTDKVINWTHSEGRKIRFRIKVGVAYGSDIELVSKILETCAKQHPDVTDKKKLEARFIDFGESSL
ncbi:MAG: mechanosensitive ion channel, partial [Chlorobi bacterium]|nr:mechanosensitive ion channel [Chlorobiota bacterium]